MKIISIVILCCVLYSSAHRYPTFDWLLSYFNINSSEYHPAIQLKGSGDESYVLRPGVTNLRLPGGETAWIPDDVPHIVCKISCGLCNYGVSPQPSMFFRYSFDESKILHLGRKYGITNYNCWQPIYIGCP